MLDRQQGTGLLRNVLYDHTFTTQRFRCSSSGIGSISCVRHPFSSRPHYSSAARLRTLSFSRCHALPLVADTAGFWIFMDIIALPLARFGGFLQEVADCCLHRATFESRVCICHPCSFLDFMRPGIRAVSLIGDLEVAKPEDP